MKNKMAVLFGFLLLTPVALADLVVYSARSEKLVKPIFEQYTKETGVGIKYTTAKAGPLVEKLKAEGKKSPADLLITVDAGNLWKAAQDGLLSSVQSEVLEKNIPSRFKDPQNRWFGLSVRARTIVYHTGRVRPSDLSTYEDLGSKKWKNRLCLRTSKKVYNQSLIAMFIAEYGEEKTEKIVRSWVSNLSTDVFSNDTKVMKAIAAGQCDVGIVNSYYFGRLVKKDKSIPLALFWPNQHLKGVHVNVSGAGVVKTSKRKKEAIRFLEWLSSKNAQNLFADSNLEYPANSTIQPHTLVKKWGRFKQNKINVAQAGALQSQAVRLMDRSGYK